MREMCIAVLCAANLGTLAYKADLNPPQTDVCQCKQQSKAIVATGQRCVVYYIPGSYGATAYRAGSFYCPNHCYYYQTTQQQPVVVQSVQPWAALATP